MRRAAKGTTKPKPAKASAKAGKVSRKPSPPATRGRGEQETVKASPKKAPKSTQKAKRGAAPKTTGGGPRAAKQHGFAPEVAPIIKHIDSIAMHLDEVAKRADAMFGDHAGAEIRKLASQVRSQVSLTVVQCSHPQMLKSEATKVEAYFRLMEPLMVELVALALLGELAQQRCLGERVDEPALYPIYSFPAPEWFGKGIKMLQGVLSREGGKSVSEYETIWKAVRMAVAYPELFASMPATIGRAAAHLGRFMYVPPQTDLVPAKGSGSGK